MNNNGAHVWMSGTLTMDAKITTGYGGKKTVAMRVIPHGTEEVIEINSTHSGIANAVETAKPQAASSIMVYGTIQHDDITGKTYIAPTTLAFDAFTIEDDQ